MPTTGQIFLLGCAVALFAVGATLSLARMWRDNLSLRIAGTFALGAGIAASIGVLVWHAAQRGQWIPISHNFDALIWLATLLALFVVYVQRTRRVGALDWFVLPIVILLLIAAGVFGRLDPHPYVRGTWSWTHRATAYGGAVAFAIAAASGAMYVLNSRRLRSKSGVASYLGSLERLEKLTMTSVTLGFALLTVGAITGVVEMLARGHNTPTPKLILAGAVWIVYAIVLHAPINPSFRGRKVAVLSMVGFVLMIGAIIAVQFSPKY
jgi:ABC-type uncharacterized transport system permease subunit